MGLRRPELRLTSGVRRLGGRQPAPVVGGPNDILTITDDGSGNALFTTAAPHGIVSGTVTVVISGASNAAYNGGLGYFVDDTPTPTTFVSFGGFAGNSSGGTWALA